ncbi:MAG TPA: hypothetical protein VHA14_00340, partial [Bryobacteraceae bacterium]|nr:hypothetical protein [Bryobacteraceae bacterium]
MRKSQAFRRNGAGRRALAVLGLLTLFLPVCIAQEPAPDPAGINTGNKSNVVDAGGSSFVVSEPTDKSAPTYTQSKKDFDDYQAQAAKEPLAVKLADSV